MIGDREAAEIDRYCRIAAANASLLNISEVLEVASLEITEEDLRDAWSDNLVLNSRYALDGGWIVARSHLNPDPVEEEMKSRTRSADNVSAALGFVSTCAGDRVVMMAISGGNSYRSAKPQDDMDFFVVTSNESVWTFMLKSLLVARFMRFVGRRCPPICLSYVMEERRVLEEFASDRGGLFARDALMTEVLAGHGFYRTLLARARWMERHFPLLYRRRVEGVVRRATLTQERQGNIVLNRFLFYTVGTYVRLKAWALNRRLYSEGRSSDAFLAYVARDRCVYESNKYIGLRKMYERRRNYG